MPQVFLQKETEENEAFLAVYATLCFLRYLLFKLSVQLN